VEVGQPFENAAALVPDNGWGETTITWNDKPSSGPAFAHWTVRQGEPVDLDVTQFVQEALAGNKKLSLRLFAPKYQRGKSFVRYGSRKGDAETRPQLFVTTVP
jgi:hyaluronate lyase